MASGPDSPSASPTPPPPPPPGYAPAAAYPPPPGRAPSSGRAKIIAVVAVVVIIGAVLGALALGHYGPFQTAGSGGSGGGGGGGGSGETYSQAVAAARPAANSTGGGPWAPLGGISVDIATSVTVNSTSLSSLAAGAGCGATLLSTASSIHQIPATSAGASSGLSNAWIVLFSASSHAVLEVAVFGGSPTALLTLTSYGGCVSHALAVGLPTPLIDSPTAASVGYTSGGSAFIAAHPSYDLTEVLTPTVTVTAAGVSSVLPAAWEVVYTTCNLGANDGTTLGGEVPIEFIASVNASTGGLVRAINDSTVTCAGGSPGGGGGGGSKPTLQSVTEAYVLTEQTTSPTSFWNNGSLITSLSNMTLGELTFAIENNTTGASVSTSGITFAVVSGFSLTVVSVYDFATNSWSNPGIGFGTASSTSHILSLNSTMSLKGDKLVITATASAPATGSISAPLGKP